MKKKNISSNDEHSANNTRLYLCVKHQLTISLTHTLTNNNFSAGKYSCENTLLCRLKCLTLVRYRF